MELNGASQASASQASASQASANGAHGGPSPEKCCWELHPSEYEWFPTYTQHNDVNMKILLRDGGIWRDPDPVRLVIDFWRDLSWHFDAADTPGKVEAVKTALKAYPLDRTRMVLRAIVGGLKDPWYREHKIDALEKLVLITKGTNARDNVDRFGTTISEDSLISYLMIADDNRRYNALLRADEFEAIDERWRFKHRKRLQREVPACFRRYMAWKAEAERTGVR